MEEYKGTVKWNINHHHVSERTSTLFGLGCWAWEPGYHYTLGIQTTCLFDICSFPLPLICDALYSYTNIIIAVVRGL